MTYMNGCPILKIVLQFILLTMLVLVSSSSIYAFNKGDNLPEIYGSTLDGRLFRLSKLIKKPIVINFFSVTCVPCTKEMPELAKLEEKFPKVQFLSIHIGNEDNEKIKKFIRKLPTAPQLVVSAGDMVKKDYNFQILPYTIYADKNGRVIYDMRGYKPKNIKIFEELLSKL